ncbi:MAG: DUF4169 family protein [Acetobacteraceae bacterium]|nr:DUF4169 family protein [Acetobacteraceae bacterium]
MGEIVNLRRAKKQRTRAEENQTARENRIRHARTAAQKANDVRAEVRRQAVLDGKKNP